MGAPFKAIFTALAAGSALALSMPASAAGYSVRGMAAQEARLVTIAYRIADASARGQLCRRVDPLTGMILHDLTQYDASSRSAVAQAFSLRTGFGVLEVVRGSVADQADLRADDEIVAINGSRVDDPREFAWAQRSSYSRMERFTALLQGALRKGPADLLIRRNGQFVSHRLQSRSGCGGDVSLSNSSRVNAWSDGRRVMVTTAMTGLAQSDDEIAFVIAHEMAHNILEHSGDNQSARKMIGSFGLGGARRAEIEADAFAVQLMARGGYRPEAGVTFLKNIRRRMWWAISLDHPGFGTRIRIVLAEMARLAAVRPAYTQEVAFENLLTQQKTAAASNWVTPAAVKFSVAPPAL